MIAAPSLGDLPRKCEQKKVMTQSPRGLVYHPKGIAMNTHRKKKRYLDAVKA